MPPTRRSHRRVGTKETAKVAKVAKGLSLSYFKPLRPFALFAVYQSQFLSGYMKENLMTPSQPLGQLLTPKRSSLSPALLLVATSARLGAAAYGLLESGAPRR